MQAAVCSLLLSRFLHNLLVCSTQSINYPNSATTMSRGERFTVDWNINGPIGSVGLSVFGMLPFGVLL